ncbi:SUMF1/EgtB/PvdO family nonheme iron enzyme [uncultured Lamprocystis sp.]|uniref:SUMF1/EgtB/PvdO family nonheme iron enzyme n=1 Tax=uncultured Lamprocystis sp. TaxID=543132 RepID=UPI00342E2C37
MPLTPPPEGEGQGRGSEGEWSRGSNRVNRGGSWRNDDPENFRGANRNRNDPGNRRDNLGFRLVSTGFKARASPPGPLPRAGRGGRRGRHSPRSVLPLPPRGRGRGEGARAREDWKLSHPLRPVSRHRGTETDRPAAASSPLGPPSPPGHTFFSPPPEGEGPGERGRGATTGCQSWQ